MQQAESQGPKVGVRAIFLTFSHVTLSSFGSPLFWARRALVERQHWLTEREFVDLLALDQLLSVRHIPLKHYDMLKACGARHGHCG